LPGIFYVKGEPKNI